MQTSVCNLIVKDTLALLFSCEFCEISKNTFFTEHLWTSASISESIKVFLCLSIYFKLSKLITFNSSLETNIFLNTIIFIKYHHLYSSCNASFNNSLFLIFCYDCIVKIIAVAFIFNIDFFDIHFIYTYNHEAHDFPTNELHQIC